MSWRNTTRIARHWAMDEHKPGKVACGLCPRHCSMREGQHGFCSVRGVVDGQLRAYSYGRSVAATEEVIETEAVNHFRPGARILSLGNVGCMMSCTFCQNWQTSQVKHLDARDVVEYTPREVVQLCLAHGIEIISWTYNDPVVWHEFVVETSKLAQWHGIRTLYKSAFYIEEGPAAELIDCIDVFSLSLKSMSEAFYREVTGGRLQPVLERIEQVRHSGRHLELSQLVIPELNDQDQDLKRTVDWVGEKLGSQVPLHFVAFHPAYKYLGVERTPLATLERARGLARQAGIEHCYVGNVYEPGLNDTHCGECGAILVTRFGLTAEVRGLESDGCCSRCGHRSSIVEPFGGDSRSTACRDESVPVRLTHHWRGDVQSAHISRVGTAGAGLTAITIRPIGGGRTVTRNLGEGLERLIVSKRDAGDRGLTLSWHGPAEFQVLPVLDRAHFPVLAGSTTKSTTFHSKEIQHETI